MTSLPTVSHATDDRSIRERLAVLIRDFNSGRVADLAGAITDIAALDARIDALEALSTNDATTFLGANVALNNTANFFNGPNTGSIGAAGQKWLIMAVALIDDTSGIALAEAAIFDGTNYVVADTARIAVANEAVPITMAVVVTLSGATTFTLRAKDQTTANGRLLTTGSTTAVANKATSITAVRLS